MPTIQDAQLRVQNVPGSPGRRHVVVTYDLLIKRDDLLDNRAVVERAIVHGQDLHDAPTQTTTTPIAVLENRWTASPGLCHRLLSTGVHRVALDVQPDWWRTDLGGGAEPIAEFPDHLRADIELLLDGDVAARASTPLLTGSWGPFGDD